MELKATTAWLNYHHLYYFWMVAKEGSITNASLKLRLSQPTISAQLRDLENYLGDKLFVRAGRGVVLTDVGKIVFQYADEIFSLGAEMLSAIKGYTGDRPLEFKVGISDAVPKLVAYRLLQPALKALSQVKIFCHEGAMTKLLADLAVHDLDLVISDAPFDPSVRVTAYNHHLGSCGVSFFATADLVSRYKEGFPASLKGAPFLMPAQGVPLRRSLENWLEELEIQVDVKGEFDDSALIKAFGEAGQGIFAMPTIIEEDLVQSYKLSCVGRSDELQTSYYALSIERKIKHPAVAAISSSARESIFGGSVEPRSKSKKT